MGKKNHRFVNAALCVAGKKIKGRGGEIIKGYGIIYTPVYERKASNHQKFKNMLRTLEGFIFSNLRTLGLKSSKI